MSARETRQKYIQEWKGSSFAFHYSPACVALLVNLVLSLLFFTVDCELSLLSAKNKCSGELHAPRKTRRTRDSRRAPNIRLKNIYRCVLRVLCPSGLVRSVYFTRSLIFSRCWRLRAVYFLPAKVDLVRLFSSQCLKFQTLRALELLRKFENIAGVQLYLHDKYQRILFQYGRYMYFEISYRTGPCCSKGGYHQTY